MSSEALAGTSPEVDYSTVSDLDLANILYIQNIPTVPAEKQRGLDARIKSINLWLAFELTRVEKKVTDMVKAGELAGDDSVASKSERTLYRYDVANAYREQSPWLITSSTTTRTSNVTATEDKISLALSRNIIGASGLPNSPQALNVVKAISNGFNGFGQIVQPHVFYTIDYYYDNVTDVFGATVNTFYFEATVTENSKITSAAKGEAVSKLHGGSSAPAAKGGAMPNDKSTKLKQYDAKLEYSNKSCDFNFDLWNKTAPKDGSVFQLGKELLGQRQLRLLKE